MSVLRQITASIVSGAVTGLKGTVLDAPDLVSPPDGSSVGKYTNDAGGSPDIITLMWNAVSGANFYVCQVCENSSFRGQTLQSYLLFVTQKQLTENIEIRRGIGTQYFWRVFAYSTITGGASSSSEIWSFKLSWLRPDINPAPQLGLNVYPNSIDFVQWSEPSFGRLIQANVLEKNEIVDSNGSPITGSPFAGTLVTIQFGFIGVSGFNMTGWYGHGITDLPAYKISDLASLVDLQYVFFRKNSLTQIDIIDPLILTDEWLTGSRQSPPPRTGLLTWDSTTKQCSHSLFLCATNNLSVGEEFVMLTTLRFKTDVPGRVYDSVTFKSSVVVQTREGQTRPPA